MWFKRGIIIFIFSFGLFVLLYVVNTPQPARAQGGAPPDVKFNGDCVSEIEWPAYYGATISGSSTGYTVPLQMSATEYYGSARVRCPITYTQAVTEVIWRSYSITSPTGVPFLEWDCATRQAGSIVSQPGDIIGNVQTWISGTYIYGKRTAESPFYPDSFLSIYRRCPDGPSSYSWVVEIVNERPPTPPECGTAITDTHFVSNTWTAVNADWTYSLYDVHPGGYIHKNGLWATSLYSVTVLAKTSETGTLHVVLDSYVADIVITPTESYNYFHTMITTTSGYKGVSLTADGGNSVNISVDQICFSSASQYATCGIVNDRHFALQNTWTPSVAGATFSPSEWELEPSASIYQYALVPVGVYTVEVVAKSDYSAILHVSVGIKSLDFTLTSAEYMTYTGMITITEQDSGITIRDDAFISVIDSICVTWVRSAYDCILPSPCGISCADQANSLNILLNSSFEDGILFPRIACDAIGFPLSLGCSYTDLTWDAFNWSIRLGSLGINVHQGMARQGPYTPRAIGLVPIPLSRGIYQHLARGNADGFNVVFRVYRYYGNSRLVVNDAKYVDSTPAQQWADYSVWFDGATDYVTFSSDCQDFWCTKYNPNDTPLPDAVILDDVFIVPGPAMQCGVPLSNTTPLGGCINQNPHFDEGSDGWTFTGSDTGIDSISWARLPAGGMIEQLVLAATSDSTWGDQTSGLVVGKTYRVEIRAQLENKDQGNTGAFSFVVGASTPGKQTFDYQLSPTHNPSDAFVSDFTITENMLVPNDDRYNVQIRLMNESGPPILIDSVCIRDNLGGDPPPANCLGTWLTSADAPGLNVMITNGNHVKNLIDLRGAYLLDIAGNLAPGASDATIRIVYGNPINGITDLVGTFIINSQAFTATHSFITPPGGYAGGKLMLIADWDLSYSQICLRPSTNGPGPGEPPAPLPFPECGSVTYTNTLFGNFYILPPYSVTAEYSGTLPSYAAELTYDYAIYPLVCTTVSIANWQYKAWNGWLIKFADYSKMMQKKLDDIIDLLQKILDKLDSMQTCGLLDVILWIFRTVFGLFIKIFQFIGSMIGLVTRNVGDYSSDLHGDSATSVSRLTDSGRASELPPISCSNEGQWLCIGLAGIMWVDQQFGSWLDIVVNVVVIILTVSLGLWVMNQVRSMLQPGTEESGID